MKEKFIAHESIFNQILEKKFIFKNSNSTFNSKSDFELIELFI